MREREAHTQTEVAKAELQNYADRLTLAIDPRYHEKIFTIFQTWQSRDEQENTGVPEWDCRS
ncbi:hypothetical protein [Leptodesmis sp.]|uniref:hypothetical protein n=1 Tax=Leptodesmis sp. TaxID=3100501 RepID=UPI004053510A